MKFLPITVQSRPNQLGRKSLETSVFVREGLLEDPVMPSYLLWTSFFTDPLMWWKQRVQEFPRLARMVRQHLAVPATSASPERLFSSVGLVKSDWRGSLLDSTMIDVMCAKQAHTLTIESLTHTCHCH